MERKRVSVKPIISENPWPLSSCILSVDKTSTTFNSLLVYCETYQQLTEENEFSTKALTIGANKTTRHIQNIMFMFLAVLIGVITLESKTTRIAHILRPDIKLFPLHLGITVN